LASFAALDFAAGELGVALVAAFLLCASNGEATSDTATIAIGARLRMREQFTAWRVLMVDARHVQRPTGPASRGATHPLLTASNC